MSISKINWHSFLSPDSALPPDVFFLIEDVEIGEEGKTIGAHRLFLAGVSPVFKGMFFGPMKDTSEVVEVKETTPDAFDTMIKYIRGLKTLYLPGGTQKSSGQKTRKSLLRHTKKVRYHLSRPTIF